MAKILTYKFGFERPDGSFQVMDEFPGQFDLGDDNKVCFDEAMRVVNRLRTLADAMERATKAVYNGGNPS